MIHFTNGSNVADTLQAGGVQGRVVACADPLHDGPCLPGLTRSQWNQMRARFLAGSHGLAVAEIVRDFEERDAAIDEAARDDQVVLWFEHDVFDQLNLLWLLDALSAAGTPRGSIQLIVIGEHPEVARFHGLGQLFPAQLIALFPDRQPLTAEASDEARAAWADVCAPDPHGLARRATSPSHCWPFLPGALGRLVQELPSVSGGLSRTERQGLDAIALAATTLGEAFAAAAAREERVFLGDSSFYAIMGRLRAVQSPLLVVEPVVDGPPDSLRSSVATLTELGERVLAGQADHATVNGLDRWVGGVHLLGKSPRFRVATEGTLTVYD